MAVLTTFPKSYLYQQYRDDEDLQALVDAYNAMQQQYIDGFNALHLPVYTLDPVSDFLLDWVLQGLYGIVRGYLPAPGGERIGGAYNTWFYDRIPYNGRKNIARQGYAPITDDVYRRVATWVLFRGDGKQFTISWLKRRIMRFLTGPDGFDGPDNAGIDETYPVSVTFTGDHEATISLDADYPNATLFQAAMSAGLLPLPLQYTFVVSLT